MSSESGKRYDFIIAGGGLAGLVSSILLSRAGFSVLLAEKKTFPFHKVCGEYVSMEVAGFLKSLGFDPFVYGAARINRLRISTPDGKNIQVPLRMGGFGLSRYRFDSELCNLAMKQGVEVRQTCRVNDILFDGNFTVETSGGTFHSAFVIGSWGKRERLDKRLHRKFIEDRTGYLAVKYHVKSDHPEDEIGMDNFPGGYCGIVRIEEGKSNLCYLFRRNGNSYHNISDLEERYLFKNPLLEKLFSRLTFLTKEPEVINEISFTPRPCVEHHVLLCGDAAGLITPICGNGMAMAIHGAKILSELLIAHVTPGEGARMDRQLLEAEYARLWKKTFSQRLFWGRTLQSLTGNPLLTGSSLRMIHAIPSLERWMVGKTHGKELK